ncbi:MAG: methyltransferase domain-containing protein [Geobacter sp.]|nr:methyltransferase domain-containing protein [Geobacter sp.]
MNRIEYRRMYEAEDQHWWYVGLHELILSLIERESRRLGHPLDIFDAGCGTGRLCQLMLQMGHRAAGCDAAQEALRLCKERGIDSMVLSDLNSIELDPETYDVITSIDVLYHTGINDDVAVLRRLRSGLKPGGMLLLNLVAHEFLRSSHDLAVHTRERYSKRMLQERVQRAGFDVILVGGRVGMLFPLITTYRLLARFLINNRTNHADVVSDVAMPHRFVNNLLLKALRLENRRINSGRMLPIGSSLFAVARRNNDTDNCQSGKFHAA